MDYRNEIISDEIIKTERYQVDFNEYANLDEISEIQMRAEECFVKLYNGLNNSDDETFSYIYFVESVIVGRDIHDISYDNYDIYHPIRSEKISVPVKAVNPNFRNIFESKLRDLAKEKMTYIEIKLMYDEEKETKFYNLTLYTEKGFEEKYGQSLYTYYFPKNISDAVTLEDKYRNALECLKQNYIKFMISDSEMGLIPDFIEGDGYLSLLMINSDYKNLSNKELIQNELGFIVDNEKGTLKLVKSRK